MRFGATYTRGFTVLSAMSEQGASEAAEEKPAEDGEAQGEEVSAALTFYLFQITKA